MLNRILKGWSFIRVFYLLAGVGMLIQSVVNKQWAFAIVGLYFAIMGLFALGCASGSCYTSASNKPSENSIQNTEYEEVK
ncbi:MAG: hypothetical protein BWZ05_00296 [Bacteroidetes bacterium ADurb.BinA245]|nr:MAG: hypothetical protein BWZ05_00296 [Bacteroidetes bacterium ADurb.BinA245]